MLTIMSYTVAAGIPLATIAVGTWTARRHDRIYPPRHRLRRRRPRQRLHVGARWRNES